LVSQQSLYKLWSCVPFSTKPIACKEITPLQVTKQLVQIFHILLLMVKHCRASLDTSPNGSVH